jgi:hypothetical protein
MTMPRLPSSDARRLGFAGLLPFVGGALGAWLAPADQQPRIAFALAAYGATIVAFLGGLHWGLAARGGQRAAQYAWGVVPSLIAWGTLLLPTDAGLALLAGALVACYAVDRRVFEAQGLGGWLPMRAALTTVAAASCLAAAFALR